MNQKTIIIAVVALVLIGLGVWAMTNRSVVPDTDPYGNEQASVTPAEETTTKPTSLSSLLALGAAQQCSFHDMSSADSMSEGVVYVGGGKVRGDFTSTIDGQAVASHMIVADQTSYVWTDGSPTGFKLTMPAAGAQQTTVPTVSGSTGVDVNKNVDYSCAPWVIDPVVFTLPAGIQFADPSALVPGGAKTTGATAAQCAACDQAQAASRAQCKAALGCK